MEICTKCVFALGVNIREQNSTCYKGIVMGIEITGWKLGNHWVFILARRVKSLLNQTIYRNLSRACKDNATESHWYERLVG